MPTPTPTARDRAEQFLRIAPDFFLGSLVTESSHPRTADLSDIARRARRTASPRCSTWIATSSEVRRVAADRAARPDGRRGARQRCARGGRLFFTGCGATGRLSIQLDSIWRAFWQDRRARGLATPSPDCWEDRTRSAMAGGDYALIKSVEGFEDFAPFGRRADRGPRPRRGRHGLRDHRRRRDVVRHRHGLAGRRSRRAGLLRLQQPGRGPARARPAQPRSDRRSADREGEPDVRADGDHRVHAHAGDQHRAAGDDHRARNGRCASCSGPMGALDIGRGPARRRAGGDARGARGRPRRACRRPRVLGPLAPAGRDRGTDLPQAAPARRTSRTPRRGRPDRHDRAQPDVLHAVVPQVRTTPTRPSRGPSCSRPVARPRRRGRRSCRARRRPSSGPRTTCGTLLDEEAADAPGGACCARLACAN